MESMKETVANCGFSVESTLSTPYEQNTIFFFLQATIFVRRTVQPGKGERSFADEMEEWLGAVAKGVV